MMRRLRWATDGGGAWELDMETPATMEGTVRAVPGDPLPLGLSRGPRITRAKQLDFMHRFMSSPLVPSFSSAGSGGGGGLLFHHAHVLHLHDNWSATVMEQFNVQKLLSLIKEHASNHLERTSWLKNIGQRMNDIFSFGFGTEIFLTPDSSFLIETYNIKKGSRNKAIFQHKFSQHNLTMEAVSPGLFVDKHGTYWDVPLSMALDLASINSGSGLSYHLCVQHNSGQPKHFAGNQTAEAPMSLLPGLSAKAAISIKKNVEFWREKEGKLKMVQPYDALLSDPHVSGSGIIGNLCTNSIATIKFFSYQNEMIDTRLTYYKCAAAIASLGNNTARLPLKEEITTSKPFTLSAQKNNFGLFADLFATVSLSAQYGNFQRLVLDLTRLNARMDFPSGSTFVAGAVRLAEKFYNSQKPDLEAIHAVCPELTVSLQQQIIGPFSFRVDSKIKLDVKNEMPFACIDESIFAIDWALKVLGSTKASF